jgi:tartrate dehydratase beta subunit/fumarate hydratase class I family protein
VYRDSTQTASKKFKNVPASPNKTSSAQTQKYPTKLLNTVTNIKFLGHGSTSKNTTNHKNKLKSISKLFHAQTGSIWFQIGYYLVPMGSRVQRLVPTKLKWFPNCLSN